MKKKTILIRKGTAYLLAAIMLSATVSSAAYASESVQVEQSEIVEEDATPIEDTAPREDTAPIEDTASIEGTVDDAATSSANEAVTNEGADGTNEAEDTDVSADSDTAVAPMEETAITSENNVDPEDEEAAADPDDHGDIPEEVDTEIVEKEALDAATEHVSGDYTYTLSSGYATIVAYAGNAANVTLPAKLDGYTVYYVNGGVFAQNTSLRTITVPSNYRRIGNIVSSGATGTFEGCTNLQGITFEDGSNDFVIGYNTFKGCASLESVTIPGNCSKILNSAFEGCSALKTVSIKAGSASLQIADKAFTGCNSLTTFAANNTLTSIGNNVFSGDSNLREINLGNRLTSIGGGAFYNCDSLESVTIPASITNIGYNRDGQGAFEKCDSLSTVTLTSGGGNAAYLGYSTFEDCTALQEITIPGNYSDIANNAFRNCTALTSVTLSNGSTALTIGSNAFSGCSSLTNVSMAENLRTIGVHAFYNDIALSTISLPEGLTTISGGAFYNCTGLSSVTIPASVTQIGYNWDGDGAFQNCTGLTSLTIQAGSKEAMIGFNAFNGCTSLEGTLTIPGNYNTIHDRAFYRCHSLKNLTYNQANNSNITQKIGAHAFEYCTALETAATSSSLREISEYAFAYDSSLNTVDLRYGVTTIADSAFINCVGLSTVTIPASVTKIGNETFTGNGVFRGCTNLVTVTIEGAPEDVTGNILGYNVFTNCKKLTAVYIPRSYTNIIWSVSWKGLERVTIWGKEGSSAESFANEHSIPFKAGQMDPQDIYIPIMSRDIFLKTDTFQYDGTPKTPEISVIIGGMKLNEGTDYTVEYENNINVGTATATVNGKGIYTGSVSIDYTIEKSEQTIAVASTFNKSYGDAAFNLGAKADGVLTYKSSNTSVAAVSSAGKVTIKGVGAATITITATSDNHKTATAKVTVNVKPAASTVSSLAAYNGSQIVVKYTKAANVSGYRIQYSLKSDMTSSKMVTIEGNSSTQKTVSGLTNGKTYYVRIRTFKEVSGKTYWSNWSAKKSVKIVQNPNPVSIATLKNVSGKKMTVTWKKISKATGYRIQYSTKSDMSGSKMVTIEGANTTSKTITGLTKGKTYYVRIRTYRKVSGKTYWSKWSAAKTVTIKK